jgi:hypothetical protein
MYSELQCRTPHLLPPLFEFAKNGIALYIHEFPPL